VKHLLDDVQAPGTCSENFLQPQLVCYVSYQPTQRVESSAYNKTYITH
jgi:hypothetical protein